MGVICHRHADPDAYMSAYALSRLMAKLAPSARVDVILPDGMSLLTRRLAESFKQENLVRGEGEGGDYDLLVAVDIGHTELLKDWFVKLKESPAVKVLIDHHPIQEGSPYDHMVVDTTASSASEIVARIFRDLGVEMEAQSAQALLLGIMFDSQHLLIAKESTLREVVRLMDRGARIDEARLLLRSPPDYGEVIAKLKSAKRLKLYKVAGWVVVTTTVGSFQSNVARSLVSMGADVAIVTGETGAETRGSLRANQRFWDATKVHLGTDVAASMAKEAGSGGGHPTAASFTCSLPEDKAAESTLALVASLLKDKPAEIR
ncbi:MAG TPA: DHH family phosphoesterase [Nitrososphaerales archaeon]|nr:DHH family phosphoesterase [Nitrososphaerales archaeon]